jgi:hypothetical protein
MRVKYIWGTWRWWSAARACVGDEEAGTSMGTMEYGDSYEIILDFKSFNCAQQYVFGVAI